MNPNCRSCHTFIPRKRRGKQTNKQKMGRKKVKQFSAPGSKTSSIPLKNPERVRGGEEVGGVERQPGARDDGEGTEGEDTKWQRGDKRFED